MSLKGRVGTYPFKDKNLGRLKEVLSTLKIFVIEKKKKTMGNCLSKESLMADYILSEQRACGWRSGTPLKPVLKCCIEANSSLGFCDVCEENFAYR
ncbi:MAG: hypothetical protein AAFY76_17630, partial [Cyanobacteria bacterium J06649_11]